MMVTSHVLVGGVVGLVLAPLLDLATGTAVVVGMIGGLVPELDFLVGTHRRSLHGPVVYLLLAGLVAAVAAVMPVLAVGIVVLVSAGVHSVMDIFAGAELRSWDRREWQQTAVYDHIRGRWIRPRRLAYGGSMPDLAIALGAGAILLGVPTVWWMRPLAWLLIGLSLAYGLGIEWFADTFVEDHGTLNGYIRDRLRTGG